jgi:type I restriction enzyme R subunit
MVETFDESVVEDAALAWLESLGWAVTHGLDIALGEPDNEWSDYRQVALEDRTRNTLPPKFISGELRENNAETLLELAV